MKYNFIDVKDYKIYPEYDILHPLYARLVKNNHLCEAEISELHNDDILYSKNPFEYKNIDEIVYILKMAIMNQDRIMVYGNYDADGICATAITVSLLQHVDARVSYYIPSRYNDGFGLNKNVLKAIKDRGYKVLITIDNGMESVELIRMARAFGMKVIIIDRHLVLGEVPMANAILNPKVCGMDEKNVSTSYMCFRLAQALSGDSNRYYVALAAIGSIAANRPYKNFNYHLIKLGLKYMNHFKFKQLEILASYPYCYSINIIKDNIINKLEAIGRAEKGIDMSVPLKMLLSEDFVSLEKHSKVLTDYSKKENKIKNKLVDEICEDFMFHNEKCIFIVDDRLDESEGSPLVDRLYFLYNVPTFVFVEDYKDSLIKKGIAKSHSSFALNKVFAKHQDLFDKFTGYATNATFTIKKSNINKINEIMKDEAFKANIMPKEKIIDVYDIEEKDITLDSVKELLTSGFCIYTNDMCFRLKNVSKDKLFKSANGFHISGKLNDNVTLVGYKLADDLELIEKDEVDIIFRPEINQFNHEVNVTLKIFFIE